ncbi:hypothetical protein BDV12DRAFT_209825 [Aspergillus spectabilis]
MRLVKRDLASVKVFQTSILIPRLWAKYVMSILHLINLPDSVVHATPAQVATWLTLGTTVVGLNSIATQFNTMIDKTDPFRSPRDGGHLGRGADLVNGFCGKKTVVISRLPLLKHTSNQAAWATLLSVIHPAPRMDEPVEVQAVTNKGTEIAARDEWVESNPELRPLVKHKLTACTVFSRTTLMTLFCVTNARAIFSYNGAPSYRATYPCYCGQWRVDGRLGMKDVYPVTFQRRVEKCLQMLARLIDAGSHGGGFRCAFPGRMAPGECVLMYTVKEFGGAHGGRHFYNMIGGNITRVDFLLMKMKSTKQSPDPTAFCLPNKENGKHDVTLYIPAEESTILDKALDYQLAETLRYAVSNWPEKLISRGWDARFVKEDMASMANMAPSAVLAGSGNSGDAVRVVTGIALALWNGPVSDLDETFFWRSTDWVRKEAFHSSEFKKNER